MTDSLLSVLASAELRACRESIPLPNGFLAVAPNHATGTFFLREIVSHLSLNVMMGTDIFLVDHPESFHERDHGFSRIRGIQSHHGYLSSAQQSFKSWSIFLCLLWTGFPWPMGLREGNFILIGFGLHFSLGTSFFYFYSIYTQIVTQRRKLLSIRSTTKNLLW